MGIDASIAMGVKPVQMESPMNALAQMMQIQQVQQSNQLNTLKMDEYQRGVGETNKMNSLYSGAIGPDGKVDRSKLILGAASQNLGSKIPALQKGFLDTDEAQGKVDKQRIDLVDAKLKQSRSFLDSVKTPDDYMAWHEGNHTDPVLGPVLAARGITAASARASIEEALKKPGGFQEMLSKSALGIEKFSEMNKPSVHVQNLGGTSQVISTPGMGGAPVMLSNSPITQSADSVATNATSRANNAATVGQAERSSLRTDARSRDTNAATMTKPFEVTGPDGTPVLVRQDKQGNISRVDGFGPKANEKPMTDAQSKAALFGSRMESADKILGTLAGQGTITSIPGAKAGYGIGAAVNVVSSAPQQQLEQAKRDFVNAVLRRESGAVISDGEFANADKQYFPQVGDSAAVIAQKASNRAIATRGIQAEVPKAQRGVIKGIINGDAAPNIDSLLDKYK